MSGFYEAAAVSSYVLAFIAVLGLVLGFVLGDVLALYGFRAAERSRDRRMRRNRQRQEKEPRKKKSRKREPRRREKQGSEDAEENTVSLRERMTDKGNSWSDFNCAADGVDEQEYVENARKQQNKSYTYVLRKNGR